MHVSPMPQVPPPDHTSPQGLAPGSPSPRFTCKILQIWDNSHPNRPYRGEPDYASSTTSIGFGVGVVSLRPIRRTPPAHAQDRIMGQIQFVQASKVVKTSGVWVDGQYVGYLGELQGRNRLRLLPGAHDILVREDGYEDYNEKAMIEPGKILDLHVALERDSRAKFPDPKTSAQVRLDVSPDRAAVFVDDNFVGHVNEFYGFGHGMLLVPGKHNIKIDLAGYKTFETDVTLLPRQKFALKTDLAAGSINDADPLIRNDRAATLGANASRPDANNPAK